MSEPKEDDGGLAFPLVGASPGMSLRDWFAGQALAGLGLHHAFNPGERRSAALCAYLIADEMLDVRGKL